MFPPVPMQPKVSELGGHVLAQLALPHEDFQELEGQIVQGPPSGPVYPGLHQQSRMLVLAFSSIVPDPAGHLPVKFARLPGAILKESSATARQGPPLGPA